MNDRINDADYIKGIMILLMVCFHIHYRGSLMAPMEAATNFVYSFHMPIFLFFSGFFVSEKKGLSIRLYALLRNIFIPYAIFEFIYIMCLYWGSKMGFSFANKVSDINFSILSEKIFLEPIGAYWYLHTLIISVAIIYLVSFYFKGNRMSLIILIGIIFFSISFLIKGFRFNNALFLLLGYYMKCFNYKIAPSLFSILPVIIIGFFTLPNSLDRGSLPSVIISILFISFLSALYFISKENIITNWLVYLGRNTLIIVLIHPIFLNLFKLSQSFFLKVDASGITYLVVISIFTTMVSLGISKLMDAIGFSNFFFGKELYMPFKKSANVLTKK